MSKKEYKIQEDPLAPRTKYKKIHVEIAPINWMNIKKAVDTYNTNPDRVTPDIKAAHIINEALDLYLNEIETTYHSEDKYAD